ncbi:hypothetical protein D5F52_26440 (plasmid) [Brevibacillus laterosporus]|uniref:hypothetical protein n=1 Tax=Brevibacillus laterosporus TaxID=1465 RepID=UPI000E6B8162|nr:hypothetical protein [Brevibacillus laterosporus]AYB41696.1 hypothetical protein D5F52_26440 [Brevibacillus laterosporus]
MIEMGQYKVLQETIFSFLGEEEPETVEIASPKQSKKVASNTNNKNKPSPKPKEVFQVNTETCIRYGGETIPLTDYFTDDEISIEVLLESNTEKGDPTHKAISIDDVRRRLENDFAELTEDLTSMSFIKEKNLIVPVLQARKKGMILKKRHGIYLSLSDAAENKRSNMYIPSSDGNIYHIRDTEHLTICKRTKSVPSLSIIKEGVQLKAPKINWDIITEFIKISRYYASKYGTEVHAEILWNGKDYRLSIPKQRVSSQLVEPETTDFIPKEDEIKVMEIHSHNFMDAYFSSQDDESEKAPILYAVIGRVTDFFPQIKVRTCLNNEYLELDPNNVFDTPFELNQSYEFKQITVHKELN